MTCEYHFHRISLFFIYYDFWLGVFMFSLPSRSTTDFICLHGNMLHFHRFSQHASQNSTHMVHRRIYIVIIIITTTTIAKTLNVFLDFLNGVILLFAMAFETRTHYKNTLVIFPNDTKLLEIEGKRGSHDSSVCARFFIIFKSLHLVSIVLSRIHQSI